MSRAPADGASPEACWVFGYGSLIWRPAFPFEEARPAGLSDWRRRFWQASTDHRGTPELPGRVVTLEPSPGAICGGMAFRLPSPDPTATLERLDERERGGYQRHRVRLRLGPPETAVSSTWASHREPPADDDAGSGPNVEGWVYIAAHRNPLFAGPSSISEIAGIVARAHGPSGSNVEYVLRLAEALRALGIEEDDTFALAALLESPGAARERSARGGR